MVSVVRVQMVDGRNSGVMSSDSSESVITGKASERMGQPGETAAGHRTVRVGRSGEDESQIRQNDRKDQLKLNYQLFILKKLYGLSLMLFGYNLKSQASI